MAVRVNITKEILFDAMRASPRALIQIEDFWLKRIVSFTRSGRSLPLEGARFKPLSQRYKEFRAKYTGNRGKLFKPSKSNLTFTGQMLESLKGRSNVRKQTVTIRATGTRDDGQSNEEVAEYVAEQGRPFLGLDLKGVKRIENIVRRDIRRQWQKRRRR